MIKNPAFIGIGPTKTASTWLYDALSETEGVEMTKLKELGFFWEFDNPRKRKTEGTASKTNFGFSKSNLRWKQHQFADMIANYRSKKFAFTAKNLRWDIKYLLQPRTLRWYLSLFPIDKISGDIDPQYIFFDAPIIQALRQTLPETKVFVVLRDPFDKYWSDLRMRRFLIEKGTLATESPETISNHLRQLVNKRPRYTDILELWRSCYTEEHFHVFYYDDLVYDSFTFLSSICSYLNLPIPSADMEILTKKVFVGKSVPMPDQARVSIQDILINDLRQLVQISDSEHPERWLQRALSERERINSQSDRDY